MINTNFLRRLRAPTGPLRKVRARCGSARGEEGLTLIEVIVSALLVAFIAIATFNGFDVAARTTADQRYHDQAVVLAAQSQEALRSDSAATLDPLERTAHVYTQTLGKETYTITQSAQWINDANPNATCSAISKEQTTRTGNYLRVATTVTWPQLAATKRPKIEQYSIITPPDGSGLEVDVTNGRTPLQPVAGVTAIAGEAESTTGEAGCVIFGAIPATRINVEAFKLGDVTPTGAIKKVSPEVLIAPNLTTHFPVTLNQGGAITAEFTYEGKTSYLGQPVKGDTFVAYNTTMKLAPNFEVGSTQFGSFGAAGEYEALPGTASASYQTTAKTPVSATYYPTGDLFPFESPWLVYAGDCPANNPHTVDPGEFPESSIPSTALEPGQNPTVKVPTSYVLLNAYKGTKAVKETLESTPRPVKITNTECASSEVPNNASKFKVEHTQSTTAEGHLETPFQPFGKSFKLCLYDAATKRTYTMEYANEKVAAFEINFYLKESSEFESTAGRKVKVKEALSNTC